MLRTWANPDRIARRIQIEERPPICDLKRAVKAMLSAADRKSGPSINFDFRLITGIYSSSKMEGNFFVIFLFLIMRRIIMGAREWVDM